MKKTLASGGGCGSEIRGNCHRLGSTTTAAAGEDDDEADGAASAAVPTRSALEERTVGPIKGVAAGGDEVGGAAVGASAWPKIFRRLLS